MMGYGYGDTGYMWLWMLGWSVLLLAGLVALVWAIIHLARGGGPEARGQSSARRILDERYARGEIGDEEYRTRRKTLE